MSKAAARQPNYRTRNGLIALCWLHHRAYGTGRLELLSHLEPRWRAEVAHAVASWADAVGAAVDLDAPMNPNERGFPFDLIEDVTGEDVRAGATGKGVDLYNVTASGKRPERLIGYEEALKETSRIEDISDELREAFQTEDKLAKQMLEIAKRRGEPGGGAKELLDAAIHAATEPDPGWAPPALSQPARRPGRRPRRRPPRTTSGWPSWCSRATRWTGSPGAASSRRRSSLPPKPPVK